MKTAVVGASGYAGGELLRILAAHPSFEVVVIAAGSNAGELITSVHPHLQEYAGQKFSALDVTKLNDCSLVFLALPHGESAKLMNSIKPEVAVIDLGADFRLSSADQWIKYYGGDYAGKLPYGLPELANKTIYLEKRIANPGCYATAISLGVAPLLSLNQVETTDVVVVAASGTTGAGRSARVNLLGSEVMNNLTSYKFGGIHQHTPEIEELLSSIANSEIKVSFTPILAPMPRGILATITCKFVGKLTTEQVREAFTKQYGTSHFVHLLEGRALPSTSAVYGSNYAHIQVAIDEHSSRVVVSVAIDNLGKGAAGQAVQNANLLFGLNESTGLLPAGIK